MLQSTVNNVAQNVINEKSFVCETCGKGFRFRSNLAEHRSVHTAAKPFVCKFCGKASRLKGNLTKHILKHHRTEQGEPSASDESILRRGGKKSVKDPLAVDFLERSMIILPHQTVQTRANGSNHHTTNTQINNMVGSSKDHHAYSGTDDRGDGPNQGYLLSFGLDGGSIDLKSENADSSIESIPDEMNEMSFQEDNDQQFKFNFSGGTPQKKDSSSTSSEFKLGDRSSSLTPEMSGLVASGSSPAFISRFGFTSTSTPNRPPQQQQPNSNSNSNLFSTTSPTALAAAACKALLFGAVQSNSSSTNNINHNNTNTIISNNFQNDNHHQDDNDLSSIDLFGGGSNPASDVQTTMEVSEGENDDLSIFGHHQQNQQFHQGFLSATTAGTSKTINGMGGFKFDTNSNNPCENNFSPSTGRTKCPKCGKHLRKPRDLITHLATIHNIPPCQAQNSMNSFGGLLGLKTTSNNTNNNNSTTSFHNTNKNNNHQSNNSDLLLAAAMKTFVASIRQQKQQKNGGEGAGSTVPEQNSTTPSTTTTAAALSTPAMDNSNNYNSSNNTGNNCNGPTTNFAQEIKQIRNCIFEMRSQMNNQKIEQLIASLDSRVGRLEKQLEMALNSIYTLVQLQTGINNNLKNVLAKST